MPQPADLTSTSSFYPYNPFLSREQNIGHFDYMIRSFQSDAGRAGGFLGARLTQERMSQGISPLAGAPSLAALAASQSSMEDLALRIAMCSIARTAMTYALNLKNDGFQVTGLEAVLTGFGAALASEVEQLKQGVRTAEQNKKRAPGAAVQQSKVASSVFTGSAGPMKPSPLLRR